ncbi:MAG: TPM domain-containing protein [Kiritimatiellae bacterium]|nr:TPM domain-containing protein [Kiritimatiellia bacterium]
MKMRAGVFVLLCMAVVRTAGASDALLARLQPAGYLNDFAGLFDEPSRVKLETFLGELKTRTGAEVAVVTLKSLEGGVIDDFANRLFEKWGIGQKGKDNGALLLTAVEDRQVWIEVGYGLEGAIPDSKAGRILDEEVIPFFKENRYADGLTHGAVALALVAAQEAGVNLTSAAPAEISMSLTGAPPASASSGQALSGGAIAALAFVAVFIFILVLVGIFGKKMGAGEYRGGSDSHSSGGGRSSSSSSGGGSSFGGFGGGRSGGGGAGRSW